MSPRGAVLGLAIAVALSLSAATLLIPIWVAVALLAAGVAASLLLNHAYAHSLDGRRRPLSRVPLDRLVATEILGAFGPPLAVAALVDRGAMPPADLDPLFAVSIGVLTAMMIVCFVSSLVDWYYVLPRRDGLVGPPPCKAPQEARWKRVTWFWLLHRFVAAVSTIGGVYAVAVCLGLWINRHYPQFSSELGGAVPILIGVATFFGRSYLRYIAQVWQLLYSPRGALGERLETRSGSDPLSGYLFNVSIERVDLLKEDDTLTHASHADTARHCHHTSREALCRTACVRGNADAEQKAPAGEHGGCLYETDERHREPAPGRRGFVF